MPSIVKIISNEDLKNFYTGTSIKRRNDLLACDELFKLSDRFGYEMSQFPIK